MDAAHPIAVARARLGREPDGRPAWFVADPDRPGKFLKVGHMNAVAMPVSITGLRAGGLRPVCRWRTAAGGADHRVAARDLAGRPAQHRKPRWLSTCRCRCGCAVALDVRRVARGAAGPGRSPRRAARQLRPDGPTLCVLERFEMSLPVSDLAALDPAARGRLGRASSGMPGGHAVRARTGSRCSAPNCCAWRRTNTCCC